MFLRNKVLFHSYLHILNRFSKTKINYSTSHNPLKLNLNLTSKDLNPPRVLAAITLNLNTKTINLLNLELTDNLRNLRQQFTKL